ncbi:MAG: signal recognition particle-docking protein FtsY [Alphaproteobacteria bacterium]|nr:signal recognition particle-docking protein FtsY [Alphaproteobacteria bacterium]MBT4018432.1 signal recognition particle-docking protein FtsY [Alphaproteobacteria bacterium]MBT4965340.1 signal recognition particle-docking protein FtsY [Alphaproteobacteria bacterium]MBT5919721.1 signal recognition particle-docking protein FtsY [Alphaproteobacteria bacterium]MBT6384919.1 signal recognition particle-docking protein FtsY [Alphaproteobacteria bacterium]
MWRHSECFDYGLRRLLPDRKNCTVSDDTEKKRGWLSRLKAGLGKSASALGDGISNIFTKRKLDTAALEELEELLITADIGLETVTRVTSALAKDRFDQEVTDEEVRGVLAEQIAEILEPLAKPLVVEGNGQPHVVLVVGVNGTGKTTTIGKLAQQMVGQGKSVMLAAGDTFRAAAIEQLKIWGERTGAPVVMGKTGADAAGLVYDALEQARAAKSDVLLVDTAGRLQNKTDLMAELEKIVRVMKKIDDTAPHSVLLVLDATTGQNAINQVEVFRSICNVTGLVMTKLDGTARGGVLVAIAAKAGLPIHAIGVGEGAEDFQAFEATAFARSLVGLPT